MYVFTFPLGSSPVGLMKWRRLKVRHYAGLGHNGNTQTGILSNTQESSGVIEQIVKVTYYSFKK